MNSDSNEERIEQLEVALSSTPKAFMEGASPKRSSDDEEPEQAIEVTPIADSKPDSNEPEVSMTKALLSIDQVEVLTEKVKAEVEVDYQEQIEALKEEISQRC